MRRTRSEREVTVSFLLITAVWTHMARINADALVPGHGEIARPIAPEKRLHVDMRPPDRFVNVTSAVD